MLDRETTTQIVVSVGAVAIFVALAAYVSGAYGTDNHLTQTGGMALVGGIAAFVLIVTVAGLWLAHQEFEDVSEEPEGDGDAADG